MADTREYRELKLPEAFADLVRLRAKASAAIATIQAKKEQLDIEITNHLLGVEAKAARVGNATVSISKGRETNTIVRELLVANGVTAAIIDKSTKTTVGRAFVTLRQA